MRITIAGLQCFGESFELTSSSYPDFFNSMASRASGYTTDVKCDQSYFRVGFERVVLVLREEVPDAVRHVNLQLVANFSDQWSEPPPYKHSMYHASSKIYYAYGE